MNVLSEIETRGGNYEIVQLEDNTYEIRRDGVSIHGVCQANDVIAWLSNALHCAEYLLMKYG